MESLEIKEKLERLESSALENLEEVSPLEYSEEYSDITSEVSEPIIEMKTCTCSGGCGSNFSYGDCTCSGSCGSNNHK